MFNSYPVYPVCNMDISTFSYNEGGGGGGGGAHRVMEEGKRESVL